MNKKDIGKQDFALRLKSLRARLKMSQRDFAKEFYVSASAITLWENKHREIPGPVRKLIEIYERIIEAQADSRHEK